LRYKSKGCRNGKQTTFSVTFAGKPFKYL
jgi:hypothetical protein